MRVFYNFEEVQQIRRPVVTIGSYDGVHVGHRTILTRMNALARERDGESVVVTFHPHPRLVVGAEPVMLLSTLSEKLRLLESVGVDCVIVVDFTHAFSLRSPRSFVCEELVGKLHLDTLLVGYNHHLGHNKAGDSGSLLALSRECGFTLQVMPPQRVGDHKVSSTMIRQMILGGDPAGVADYLQAPYGIAGVLSAEGELSAVDPCKLLPCVGEYPVVCTPQEHSVGAFPARLSVSENRCLRLVGSDHVAIPQPVRVEFTEKIVETV